MTIFPPETLGLRNYKQRYVPPRNVVTDGGQPAFGRSTRRYEQDVLYHYEREHL